MQEGPAYRSILVPLDGSSLSEAVLPYARTLASRLGTRVRLLQVIEPSVIDALARQKRGTPREVVEYQTTQEAQEYLENIARTFPPLPQAPEAVVVQGNPAEAIVTLAGEEPGTLITMATHGRSGIGRWLLGSVADKVIHAITAPVFLVRPTRHAESLGEAVITNVIVTLDGSELAEQALPHAVALSRALRARLTLVRVVALPVAVVASVDVPTGMEQVLKEMEEEASAYLEGHATTLREEGVEVSTAVLRGSPPAQIVDFARNTPNAVVVMTTRGLSGLGRWLLGSVTERVVHHSGVPVLVIRSESREGK